MLISTVRRNLDELAFEPVPCPDCGGAYVALLGRLTERVALLECFSGHAVFASEQSARALMSGLSEPEPSLVRDEPDWVVSGGEKKDGFVGLSGVSLTDELGPRVSFWTSDDIDVPGGLERFVLTASVAPVGKVFDLGDGCTAEVLSHAPIRDVEVGPPFKTDGVVVRSAVGPLKELKNKQALIRKRFERFKSTIRENLPEGALATFELGEIVRYHRRERVEFSAHLAFAFDHGTTIRAWSNIYPLEPGLQSIVFERPLKKTIEWVLNHVGREATSRLGARRHASSD